VAQAVVEQDAKGKVHIHEPGRAGVGAGVEAAAGVIADAWEVDTK
jgi:hypothetical protein